MTLTEIIAKRKEFTQGTRVTNCVRHSGLQWHDRPDDCRHCVADMKSMITLLIRVNEFCNELLDQVERVIE